MRVSRDTWKRKPQVQISKALSQGQVLAGALSQDTLTDAARSQGQVRISWQAQRFRKIDK